MSVTIESLQEKITKLREENASRVAQVKQHQQQIEQSQAAITSIKEQHDHSRGKIDMLTELLSEKENVASTNVDNSK
jgi:chromosome segregation ATPase